MPKAERFDFVVAHPWPNKEDGLAIYAYGSEVQQNGTMKDAKGFLAYVKRQDPDEDWAIYRVTFSPIDGVKTASAASTYTPPQNYCKQCQQTVNWSPCVTDGEAINCVLAQQSRSNGVLGRVEGKAG